MKYSWATDLHLNFIGSRPGAVDALGDYMKNDTPNSEVLLITGDTSEGPYLKEHLVTLQKTTGKIIYFIIGNHDYYGSAWGSLEDSLEDLPENIILLDNLNYIKHSEEICIIGQSGWFDGILDRKKGFVIGETQRIGGCKFDPPDLILQKAETRSKTQALYFEGKVKQAYADGFRKIVFMTHAPPFAKASWHLGNHSEPGWLGIMTSGHMGVSIQHMSDTYKDLDIVVLCGHTHSSGEYNRGDRIKVLTGDAQYYNPWFVTGFSEFKLEDLFVFDKQITNWSFDKSDTERL
jgi:predicted phosphohydrolase